MMTLLAGTAVIVGAIYMLGAYKKTFFGVVHKDENRKLKDLNVREYLTLIPLTLLVIILGVYPKPVLETVDNSVKVVLNIMYQKAISDESRDVIANPKFGEME
jgi:NADH-quinone oxidoreductase subunit M